MRLFCRHHCAHISCSSSIFFSFSMSRRNNAFGRALPPQGATYGVTLQCGLAYSPKKHDFWAAWAIFKQLSFSVLRFLSTFKKNFFSVYSFAFLSMDVSCHFENSTLNYILPKTDLCIFSLLVLHPAVGEARYNTMLPSTPVCLSLLFVFVARTNDKTRLFRNFFPIVSKSHHDSYRSE